MEGPEQLEVGPSAPSRHRRWLVVGAAVLVVTGLGVLRVTGSAPAPGPVPTRPSSGPTAASSTSAPWPAGADLPPGTLYVLAGEGLYTVDAGSGQVTKTRVSLDAPDSRLTPMSGGVLIWNVEGARPPQLLGHDSQDAQEVGGGARGATTFLPGAGDEVWAAEIDRRQPAPRSAWRLVDGEGRVTATTEVRGYAVGDGAGGLFGIEGATLRHVWPTPLGPWSADLMATGRDGYELLRCAQRKCSVELHDRASRSGTPAGAIPLFEDPGALSPGNAYVAYVGQGPDAGDEVRVVDAGSAALRRSFPSGSYATSFGWLSDRWFVATSRRGVVLYDPVDDVLLHPDLPVDEIEQLVWQPS